MCPRHLTAALCPLLGAVLLAGCGSSNGPGASSTRAVSTSPSVHAAPELESMLPATFHGERLIRRSTTGAVVFGGDRFSRAMAGFLRSRGKTPADLRFANAVSPKIGGLESGVFHLGGVGGGALARAIVNASKPGAPGLAAEDTTLAGKKVVRVTYPGGQRLYLYPYQELVFYVGTQSAKQAADMLSLLP